MLFKSPDDIMLSLQRDLGIRNHGREKESMCMSAYITKDPYNSKSKDLIDKLDPAFVRAMPDETAGVSTSAGNKR